MTLFSPRNNHNHKNNPHTNIAASHTGEGPSCLLISSKENGKIFLLSVFSIIRYFYIKEKLRWKYWFHHPVQSTLITQAYYFQICIDLFIQFCQINFKTYNLKVILNMLPPSVIGALVYQPSDPCLNPGGFVQSQLLRGEQIKLLPTITIQSLFTCLCFSMLKCSDILRQVLCSIKKKT